MSHIENAVVYYYYSYQLVGLVVGTTHKKVVKFHIFINNKTGEVTGDYEQQQKKSFFLIKNFDLKKMHYYR